MPAICHIYIRYQVTIVSCGVCALFLAAFGWVPLPERVVSFLADWLSFLNEHEARHFSLLMSFVRAFFTGLGEEHIPVAFLNGAHKGTSQGLKLKEVSYAHGFLLGEG